MRLAAMHPEKGTIYVLLFNNKILEVQQKPPAEFLLRSYGKKARVLKLNQAAAQPIFRPPRRPRPRPRARAAPWARARAPPRIFTNMIPLLFGSRGHSFWHKARFKGA